MATSTSPLSGSLKDFGLVEIMQMMELGGMTGALHLKNVDGRVGILYLDNGKLANCSELDSGALTLGDVLQQLGMATYVQIEHAFSQQLQDAFGKRIGERLVAMGVINRQQLGEALTTKALWTARELALWQTGTYEFISSTNGQQVFPYGETPLNMELMRVTMEMVHYSDEWEQLKQFLPQGMRTTLQLAPALPYTMNFDIRTYELFTHVNLYRRVRRIASRLRRPELDVARELAWFVQQRYLQTFSLQEAAPRPSGRGVRLPEPAEKMRMESFELLNLISRMEQEWLKKRTPMEQLPTLVDFINWTMDALAEACRTNGTDLDQDTLESLLKRENLYYIGTYKFKIEQNHIDTDDFTTLCYKIMGGEMKMAAEFYDMSSSVLQKTLRSIFALINARVADPFERLENEEVWEAMFSQFALERSS